MRLMDGINSYKTIYKPSGLCVANYARMQITLSRRALTRHTREAEAVLSLRVFARQHHYNSLALLRYQTFAYVFKMLLQLLGET